LAAPHSPPPSPRMKFNNLNRISYAQEGISVLAREWPVYLKAQTEEQRKWGINVSTKITTFRTALSNNNYNNNNKFRKELM
jgi:diacylglycerol kinase family enzyme